MSMSKRSCGKRKQNNIVTYKVTYKLQLGK